MNECEKSIRGKKNTPPTRNHCKGHRPDRKETVGRIQVRIVASQPVTCERDDVGFAQHELTIVVLRVVVPVVLIVQVVAFRAARVLSLNVQ